MQHKSTQFTGRHVLVTVEMSLSELLALQETLASATEFMDYGPIEETRAFRQLVTITGVIEEAKEVQVAFQG